MFVVLNQTILHTLQGKSNSGILPQMIFSLLRFFVFDIGLAKIYIQEIIKHIPYTISTLPVIVPKNLWHIHKPASIIRSKLEFIGIINRRGKMTNSIGDDCIKMPEIKKEMFTMNIALYDSMQKDFDEYLGIMTNSIIKRGDRKYMVMPASNDKTILAIGKHDCNFEQLTLDIQRTLKHSNQFLGESL